MLFIAAYLLAGNKQISPPPNRQELPFPAYIVPGVRRPHWVILGVGDDDAVNLLAKNHVSWMTMPSSISGREHDRKLNQAEWEHPNRYSIEVGEDQYEMARKVLEADDPEGAHSVLGDPKTKPSVIFPPPSDREIGSVFAAHRTIFRQLARMSLRDKALAEVGSDGFKPFDLSEIHISDARIERYRALLKKVSPDSFSGETRMRSISNSGNWATSFLLNSTKGSVSG